MKSDESQDQDLSRVREFDGLCDAFEQSLSSGGAPQIEDYLAQIGGTRRDALLAELVEIEIQFRHENELPLEIEAFKQRFPDHASIIDDALASYKAELGSTEETVTLGSATPRPGSGFHVRCPHCQNPIELLIDAALTDIPCPSCGSSFHLAGDGAERAEITSIGQFKLIERVGVGAFGTVWKAQDTTLDRSVAIKIPRRENVSDGDDNGEMFFREARSAAQLRHPNIVSVHEVGRDADRIYIVSEFIEGRSLHELLEESQPGTMESVRLAKTLAEALEHAHQQGVIHRDLKPSNVMVDPDGQPHVMDFGLAKREAGEITMTMEGQILGTPAYMSPEQAKGEGHAADRRSDIYSLGAMLYRMLTGELPFRGSTRMLIYKVIHDDPPSPRQMDSTIPRDLETIVLKCLEKDPARRYQSAQELADELQRFRRSEPIRSRPIGRLEKIWRWSRRNQLVAGLIATVIAVLSAGLIATGSLAIVASNNASEALENASTATRNAELLQDALEDVEREALVARRQIVKLFISKSTHAIEQNDVDAGLLWAATALENDPDRKVNEDIHRLRLGAGISRQLQLVGLAVQDRAILQVRPDRNAERVITRTTNGQAWLWNIRQAKAIRPKLPHPGPVTSVAMLPDGDKAITGCGDGIARIWQVSSGLYLGRVDHQAPISHVAVMPGERMFLTTGGDAGVKIWDCDSRRLVQAIPTTREMVYAEFSADGQTLVTESTEGTARMWDVSTGEPLFEEVPHFRYEDYLQRPQLSPDGERMLTSYGPHAGPSKTVNATGIQLYSRRGDLLWSRKLFNAVPLRFSADGRRAVCGSAERAGIINIDDGNLAPFIELPRECQLATLVSNNRLITSTSGGRIQLWDLSDSTEPLREAHAGNTARDLISVLGGEMILASFLDGTVRLYDLRDPIQPIPNPIGPVTSDRFHFLPDSQTALAVQGGAIYRVDTQTGGSISGKCNTPPGAQFAAVDRTGARVAYVCPDERIVVLDLDQGIDILNVAIPGKNQPLTRVAFSDDGRRLAAGRYSFANLVAVWNVDTGKKLSEFSPQRGWLNDLEFSADGKVLLICSSDTTARLWDAATGQPSGAPLRHESFVRRGAIHIDNRRVLTSHARLGLFIWDGKTGDRISDWNLSNHFGKAEYERLRKKSDWPDVRFRDDDQGIRFNIGDEHFAIDAAPLQIEFEQLGPLIELLTGKYIDPQTQGVGFLPSNHFKKNTGRYLDAWHQFRSIPRKSESDSETGKWQRAIEWYDSLISVDKSDPILFLSRAEAHLALKQWALAKDDWQRAVDLAPAQGATAFMAYYREQRWSDAAEFGMRYIDADPDDSWRWIQVAPVLLLAGQQEDYSLLCERAAEHFYSTTDAVVSERITRSMLLLPDGIDPDRLPTQPLIETLDKGAVTAEFQPWFCLARAMLAYRTGDTKVAMKYATRAEHSWDIARAKSLAVQALVQHELNNTEEAANAFREAKQLLQKVERNQGGAVHDRQMTRILLREAEVKIFPTEFSSEYSKPLQLTPGQTLKARVNTGRYVDAWRPFRSLLPENKSDSESESWRPVIEWYDPPISAVTIDPILYQSRAEAHIALKEWELAKEDWQRAIKLDPARATSAFQAFYREHRWPDAADFGTRYVDAAPDKSWRWMEVAPLLLLAGQQADYSLLCERAAEHFSGTTSVVVSEQITRSMLLLPDAIDPNRLPTQPLIEALDKGAVPIRSQSWLRIARALLAYRTGDAEAAMQFITRAEHSSDIPRVTSLAVLALVYQELNNTEGAATAFREAKQLLQKLEANEHMAPHDRQMTKILLREAEAKISGQ